MLLEGQQGSLVDGKMATHQTVWMFTKTLTMAKTPVSKPYMNTSRGGW